LIHLDTSFLVHALVAGSPQDRRLRRWLGEGERLGIGAVAWTEFLCGPVDAEQVEQVLRFVARPAAFTDEDAALAARLFDESGRRRGSLGDCMVAASAIRARAALATDDARDFGRFAASGLTLAAG
jgi:predicted nucleic acid-binding protein